MYVLRTAVTHSVYSAISFLQQAFFLTAISFSSSTVLTSLRLFVTSLQLSLLQSTCVSLLRGQRLHIPDALRILVNTSITAEEPHSRHTGDTLADPLILVLVRLVNQRLCLVVAVEVVRDEVVITMLFDGTDESRESTCVTESAFLDFLEHFGEIGVEGVRTVGVRVAEVFDVFSEITKEEDVVLADFAGDFNLLN